MNEVGKYKGYSNINTMNREVFLTQLGCNQSFQKPGHMKLYKSWRLNFVALHFMLMSSKGTLNTSRMLVFIITSCTFFGYVSSFQIPISISPVAMIQNFTGAPSDFDASKSHQVSTSSICVMNFISILQHL